MRGSRRLLRLQADVGAQLRALREARGLTQERLAEKVGVGARHLQKVEAGEVNVTLVTLVQFAEALHADVDVRVTERPKKKG
ncbi:MAG: helix-turn-helix transcriptional regulator [Deltaproteobacteria bacterium]|nr:helix-turn-helix transcriptional regulator [Deltaproteobacteria bacterium]